MNATPSASEVMDRYLEAIRSGDRQRAYALIAADAVGYVPGRSALAGTLRGRQAFVDYIETVVARAGGDVTVELVDRLEGGERVALLVRERLAAPDGRVLDIRRCNVYRVVGGEIVEIRIFEGDQYAVDDYLDPA